MVERTEAQGFDEFTGLVESVEYEEPREGSASDNPQYHIIMDPKDVTVKGKTGKMHEWIKLSGTATETSVPQDSVADKYLRALERLDKSVKNLTTVKEAFQYMVGKTFRFNKETLGRAYGGHPAASYWVPVELVK